MQEAATKSEIAQAGERFAILDHAPIGQLILRRDFRVLFWNRCLEAWTGISRKEIVGNPLLDHFPHLGAAKYRDRIQSLFHGGPPAIFSPQLHRYVIPASLPSGKLRTQYTVVTAVPAPDAETCYAMFAIQDVTSLTEAIENHRLVLQRLMEEMEERRRAEAQLIKTAEELKRLNRILKQRAVRDGLTGLFNHRYFFQVLRRDFLLASREGSDLACLLLDLDHFKHINDIYGHPAGDSVLREAARIVRQTVRKTDVVARYGGEEFAVLLPNTDLPGALVIAEHIRVRLMQREFRCGSQAIRLTASIGLATRLTGQPAKPQDLLACADQALYRAKAAGRNRSIGYGLPPLPVQALN